MFLIISEIYLFLFRTHVKIAQRNTTMPQELGQIEAASTVHEYKRKAKNEQPTDNMDTHFQKTSL